MTKSKLNLIKLEDIKDDDLQSSSDNDPVSEAGNMMKDLRNMKAQRNLIKQRKKLTKSNSCSEKQTLELKRIETFNN